MGDNAGAMSVEEKEDAQTVENRFKGRYMHLKRMYEERLERVAKRVADVSVIIENDPVLSKMKSDPTTRPFVQARSQEIAVEALADEREEQISILTEELSMVTAQSEELEEQCRKLNRARRQLGKKLKGSESARQALGQQVEDLKASAAQAEEQRCVFDSERAKESNNLRLAIRRLGSVVSKAMSESRDSQAVGGGEREDLLFSSIFESEAFYGAEHASDPGAEYNLALERLSVLEKVLQKSRLHLSQGQTLEVERLRDQNSECLKTMKKLQERLEERSRELAARNSELQRATSALARSEEDRLDLREQYVAIGTKLEKVVASNEEHGRRELSAVQVRLEQSESKRQHYVDLCDRLHSELNSCKLVLARKESAVADLEDRMNNLRKEHENRIESLESAHRLALETHQTRSKSLEERLNESRSEYESKLSRANTEAKDAMRSAREGQARWEADKDRHLREFQSKLESQFQKLLDAKQKELDNALRSKQTALSRRADESERLEKQVASRVQAILQDHISLSQHREILEHQANSSREHFARNMDDLRERMQQEGRREVFEAEEKCKAAFQAQEFALQQELETTRLQQSQGDRERRELEAALEEDRKRLVAYRRQIDEQVRKQKVCTQNLQQALANIERLKKIVREQQHRGVERESTLRAHEDAEKESLRGTIQGLEEQLVASRAAVAKLEKEKLVMENEYEFKLNKVSYNAQNNHNETSKELTAIKSLHEKTMLELESRKEAELAQCEERLGHQYEMLQVKSANALKESQARVARLEEEVSALRKQLDGAQRAHHESKQSIASLQVKVERAHADRATAQAQAKELGVHLESKRAVAGSLQSGSERNMSKCLELHRSCHAMRVSFSALAVDVKRLMEANERELQLGASRIQEFFALQSDQKSRRFSGQMQELEGAHRARVEALQNEIRFLQDKIAAMDQRSADMLAGKSEVEADIREQLAIARRENQELGKVLADEKALGAKTEIVAQRLQKDLDASQDRLNQAQEEAATARRRISDLEHEVEHHSTTINSMLATLRDKLPFPSASKDKELSTQFHRLMTLAIKSHDEKVIERAEMPLKTQLASLAGAREELEQTRERVQALEKQQLVEKQNATRLQLSLEQAREQLAANEVNRTELSQQLRSMEAKLDNVREANEAEKARLQEQFNRSLDALRSTHDQHLDTLKSEVQATEESAKVKLEKEKSRYKKLQEEFLYRSDQAAFAELGPSMGMPGSPRDRPLTAGSTALDSSCAEDFAEYARLMQRSTDIDNAAQDFLRSSLRSSASMSQYSTRSAGSAMTPNRGRRDNLGVFVGTASGGRLRSVHISRTPKSER